MKVLFQSPKHVPQNKTGPTIIHELEEKRVLLTLVGLVCLTSTLLQKITFSVGLHVV